MIKNSIKQYKFKKSTINEESNNNRYIKINHIYNILLFLISL